MLDNYYDNIMFHRCIDNFLIQVGERNISSDVDEYKFESIDLDKKKLEVSPRLKFNHRGQVAWALPLEEGGMDSATRLSLSRQFFITMDEAPFLDNKYVIFGSIRGDTIFNALRIGKTETIGESGEIADKDNPPMIKSIRIENHIFDDLVATNEKLLPWKENTSRGKKVTNDSSNKRKKKRKGKRDLNVLSFGHEMEDADDSHNIGGGMSSSHDLQHVQTTRGNKDICEKKMKTNEHFLPQHLDVDRSDRNCVHETNNNNRFSEENFRDSREKYSGVNEMISAKETTTLKSSKEGNMEIPMTTSKEVGTSALESRRMKYLNGRRSQNYSKRDSKIRDVSTMAKLSQFKSEMFKVKGVEIGNVKASGVSPSWQSMDKSIATRMANRLEFAKTAQKRSHKAVPVAYSGKILEDDDHDYSGKDRDWLKHKFKCRRHVDHDLKDEVLGGDGRKAQDYEVIDDKNRGHHSLRRGHKNNRTSSRS